VIVNFSRRTLLYGVSQSHPVMALVLVVLNYKTLQPLSW